MAGIPSKRYSFRFAENEICSGVSPVMDGDDLYILYERAVLSAGELRHIDSCIRKYDLNTYKGEEAVEYNSRNLANRNSQLIEFGDYLCVKGGAGKVLRKSDLSVVYSETLDDISANGWVPYTSSFLFCEKYYRSIDYEVPSMGFDVVDIKTRAVVGHEDLDFQFHFGLLDNGLCVGQRESGNFAIWSTEKSEFLFELNISNYSFMANLPRNIKYSVFGDVMVALVGAVIVVLDLVDMAVIKEIRYLEVEKLSTMREQSGSSGIALMWNIAFDGERVFLGDGVTLSCISLQGEFLWLSAESSYSRISGCVLSGDMIFGSIDKRPVAWDKYDGEKIWQASVALPCLNIVLGKKWVVYFSVIGHLACYNWKKEYISPGRPVLIQ